MNLISYDDAVALDRNGIPVLAMDTAHTPEYWQNFNPSLKSSNWVFAKKFDTFVMSVSSANPISVSDGEFYLLTTKIQKMKIQDGKIMEAEDLTRTRGIAQFKTYREADEVCLSLSRNYYKLLNGE